MYNPDYLTIVRTESNAKRIEVGFGKAFSLGNGFYECPSKIGNLNPILEFLNIPRVYWPRQVRRHHLWGYDR